MKEKWANRLIQSFELGYGWATVGWLVVESLVRPQGPSCFFCSCCMEDVATSVDHGDNNKPQFLRPLLNVPSP